MHPKTTDANLEAALVTALKLMLSWEQMLKTPQAKEALPPSDITGAHCLLGQARERLATIDPKFKTLTVAEFIAFGDGSVL
jgi:hypothetical protein